MKFLEKLKSKYIFPVCIIAICLLVGFACFNAYRNRTITIGVFVGSPWGVPDAYSYEFIDDAIKAFEDKYPGVHVEYVSGIMKEDYSEWLSSKILSGTAPDVFMILPEDFSLLEKIGSCMPLDNIIERDKSFDSNDFYEGAYEFGNVNGVQYAIPFESAPDMMFVNKTLLAKETILVPDEDWTWDDLYNICQRVTKDTDGNGIVDQFGIYNYSWEQAFISNGVEYFDEDGKYCSIQGENAVEAVDFLKKLDALKCGAVVKATDFDMGKVAFMPVTLAEYRTYKPYPWSIKKYSNFNWECITLPKGPNGSNKSKMNTLLMGMNSRTHNKKLAFELMKMFCYDKDIQFEVYKYRGGGSVLKSIINENQALLIENQALPKNSSLNVGIIHSIMEEGIKDYNFRDVNEAKKIISEDINSIIENDENSLIALKHLQRKVNQYLNK